MEKSSEGKFQYKKKTIENNTKAKQLINEVKKLIGVRRKWCGTWWSNWFISDTTEKGCENYDESTFQAISGRFRQF